jgi:hypothetical protein
MPLDFIALILEVKGPARNETRRDAFSSFHPNLILNQG